MVNSRLNQTGVLLLLLCAMASAVDHEPNAPQGWSDSSDDELFGDAEIAATSGTEERGNI